MTLKLDMVQTLALAAIVLFIGYAVRKRVPFLDRYVPMVGAFFIDFTNALIITTFINWVH